jgi:hypothetical protein
VSAGEHWIRVRSGLWRHLDGQGFERFELARSSDGWRLAGTIVAQGPGGPVEARYQVACDAEWRTRRANVILQEDAGERRLALEVSDGRWLANGEALTGLGGCADVDLEWTPSTNTLPLRRLAPPVGAGTGPLPVAWVRFPALTVERAEQEYRRTSERRYHFSTGSFHADLDVDDEGLVVLYQDGWERVGPYR